MNVAAFLMTSQVRFPSNGVYSLYTGLRGQTPRHPCGTLKCENASICEKTAKCEEMSTSNVKNDAICEKITLTVNCFFFHLTRQHFSHL